MTHEHPGSPRTINFRWRGFCVSLLIILGLLSFTIYTFAHWAERQLLTTDNWVAMVAPLPKDNTVATALANYTVNQVFTATDLDARIQEALPDKAAFLAPVLTSQLEERLEKRTKQFIKSDQFSTLWETANRKASERLLASARGESAPVVKAPVAIDLNLGAMREIVSNQLNPTNGAQDETETVAPSKAEKVGLVVNLKTSVEKVKSYVRAIDFLNGTVGFLSVVCFLGAVVITRQRRRILMVISACLAVVATLQLIGVKAVQPYVLDQVQDKAYLPAVEVVYDSLLASFHRNATVVLVVSLIILVIASLWRRSVVERSSRLKGWLKSAENSSVRQKWTGFRALVRQYWLWIVAAAIFMWLLLMAFVLNFDTQGLVRALLSMLLTVELISLVAARAKGRRMKQ